MHWKWLPGVLSWERWQACGQQVCHDWLITVPTGEGEVNMWMLYLCPPWSKCYHGDFHFLTLWFYAFILFFFFFMLLSLMWLYQACIYLWDVTSISAEKPSFWVHFPSAQHHNTVALNFKSTQQMHNNIVSAKHFIKSGISNRKHSPASSEKPAWGK